MRCSTDIMAGKECLKLCNTIFIGLLDTTAEGLVDVGQVVGVPLPALFTPA